ncbi:MAG: hypothetical protein IJD68_01645 [Ruminococcus sp.]|nr:hypothetical protein [Ruminococcus sp.]
MTANNLPLLLLDNSSMMSVINEGEFRCSNMSFEDAKLLLEIFDEKEYLKCFSNPAIESVMFEQLEIQKRDFEYKHIRNMRVNQQAIVFKLYSTPSASNPIIQADDGVEAKKIQNVYAYCQHLIRVK